MTQQSLRAAKRVSAITIIAVAATASLAGCSPAKATKAEPQTITIAYAIANADQKNYYQYLAQEYASEHKGVTIKTDPINLTAYGQTLNTQLQAGNGPDVFYVSPGSGEAGSVVPLAKAGLLKSLTSSAIQKIIPSDAKAQFTYGGKTYAMPVDVSAAGVIWNKPAAEAVGVNISSSLETIISKCPAVQAQGKSVFVLSGSQGPNTGILAMEIAASQVYGSDPTWNAERAAGKVTFAKSKGWKSTLQTLVDLNKAGCFQQGVAGAGYDAINKGISQVSTYGSFAPGGAASDMMAQYSNVKLDVQAFPAPKGTTKYLVASSSDALSVNAKTKSPKLAEAFLTWWAQPKQYEQFARLSGNLPVGGSSGNLLPIYSDLKPIIDAKHVVPFPNLDWPNGQVYDALGTGITGLLTGQATVDQVLQNMDQAWGN